MLNQKIEQKKEPVGLAFDFGSDDAKIAGVTAISAHNCSTFAVEMQELEQKFTPKRQDAEKLSASYRRLQYYRKADRVLSCGTVLEFAHAISSDGTVAEKGKLHNANFCRDRLCPMCSWRRSYKIFAQVSNLMRHCDDNYAFLFLTLTATNVDGSELSKSLDKFFSAWSELIRNKRFKKAIKGYFRAFEVTRNNKHYSPFYGTYHPHFHCVLVVNKSYFTSRDYIPQAEWLQMWRDCMDDQTITQVDIRRAKGKNGSIEAEALSAAVAEIAKYAVKSSDYLTPDDSLTDEIVSILGNALSNRRLCTFDRSGVFGKIRRKLALDDPEDGDLIHLSDEDKIDPAVAHLICRYGWTAGAYKMDTSFIKEVVI